MKKKRTGKKEKESNCVEKEGKDFYITIGVKPNSNKTKFYRDYGGAVMMRVGAPPAKGKANKEIKKFLKSLTGGRARIVRGKKATTKIIAINNPDPRYQTMNAKEIEDSLLENE